MGVIAAITVPTLMNKTNNAEQSAKIKKFFSTIANTMTRVKIAGGDVALDDVKDADINSIKQWFDTYMKPYLITTKVCHDTAGCRKRYFYCSLYKQGISSCLQR